MFICCLILALFGWFVFPVSKSRLNVSVGVNRSCAIHYCTSKLVRFPRVFFTLLQETIIRLVSCTVSVFAQVIANITIPIKTNVDYVI
jgi:hypothetical protein